ncbi:MAG: hypothetical protein C4329_14515 [Chitinophagaceae bacterium]
MKKIILVLAGIACIDSAYAQKGSTYSNSVGLKVDFGNDYKALMGVSGKHFFNKHSAGEAQINFG